MPLSLSNMHQLFSYLSGHDRPFVGVVRIHSKYLLQKVRSPTKIKKCSMDDTEMYLVVRF